MRKESLILHVFLNTFGLKFCYDLAGKQSNNPSEQAKNASRERVAV